MHLRSRSEQGDISSPRSSRAPSFSSDRPSVAGSVTFQMPSSVRPAPAYIAASVASQIVTDHHNAQLRDDHDSENGDAPAVLVNALFSERALCLLNGFLDHLLFAFLSTARSPSLTAIRPAITDVLKPRLAREAMEAADEELQGLLAGEDDEEFPAKDGNAPDKWDVEKVWKRTRLRIMVYTRLGELEDEDEERYVQQERGLSMDDSDDDETGLVSWASAIFLTSVVEYIAEQTLLISGTSAFARMSAKMKKRAQQTADGEEEPLERIVVEEPDVEKIALNSALGRLWRTWRKRVRTPITPLSPGRGVRYMSSYTSLHRRRISHDTIDDSIAGDGVPEVPEHKPTETEIAANIPLPMGDNDVNEIEVPGLAQTYEDTESNGTETPVARPQRPASVIMLAPAETFRRRQAKERPVSMPPPPAGELVVPTRSAEPDSQSTPEEDSFETPMERVSDDESYIHDEQQESMHHGIDEVQEEEGEGEADAAMVAFAASTGMGFGMSPIDPGKTDHFAKYEDETKTPTQTAYNGKTQVMQGKRVSIEKTGPPGVVRTFSTRSSRNDKTPVSTPGAAPREGKSYLDDIQPEDDLSGPEAIGVAHTSNVPIRTTPSPPADTVTSDKKKHPAHGGYVELQPRQVAPTSITVRRSPTPEEGFRNVESSVPRREVQRKEVSRKEVVKDKDISRKEVAKEREIPRKEVTPTPSRTREATATPPAARGTVLPSLQESESWTNQSQQKASPEKQAQRDSPSKDSPRQSSSLRTRETPVAVAERPAKRTSGEGSQSSRSRAGTVEGAPEKATLQRVSSSSSTNRSVGTSILHSARDSETSLNGRPRGLSGRMSEEDREREFDTLVKGQETVKYTLTPQSMRDMDEPPVVKRVEPHKPTSSVTVYPRVTADKDSSFGSSHLPARSSSRSKPPTTSSSKKSSVAKPLAREPRIQTESMRDFADFIRSTGPRAGEERPVQPFVNLSSPNPKSTNGSTSSLGGLGRKLSTRQSSSHSHSGSGVGDGPSARPRIHMEPRSPAGQRSGNDDLIDFIRQGPPGASNGQHRIPRAVAPFRSTVDSDQFDDMLDNGKVESAYGSQVSTNSKQSAQTSNSRTGLIPAANVVQPAYSNTPQKLSGNMSSPEPQIQRTRRRIKDPYAIDLSDDEDDDMLTALPNKSRRQEESLMDFLNGMDPPTSNEPQPLMLSPQALAAAKARAQQQQNTAASPPGSVSSSGTVRNGTSSPRAPNTTSAKPAVISSNITSNAPRAHQPKLQARTAGARDARAGRSATNDLADFLRTSGPPEPSAPAPGATIRKDETQGKRMNAKFWRKKTYPDMP